MMMMQNATVFNVPSKTDGYPDQSTKWNQTKNLSGKRLKTDQYDQVRLRYDTIVCIQRAVKS